MTIQELALQGKHNLFNSMAAGVTGRILELRNEGIRESLTHFEGIEHRLEFIATVNDIKFINDSKATNVNSVWYALECMETPVIWVAGGVDKGNDYSDLLSLVEKKVKHLICLGKDNKKLIKTFSHLVESVHVAKTATEAVQIAYDLGTPNDTVLLSPACASFDIFGSYEERGFKFKQAVKEL
jgi:UDP-N-acetylmuramoylalanine--D-glutamate ligase